MFNFRGWTCLKILEKVCKIFFDPTFDLLSGCGWVEGTPDISLSGLLEAFCGRIYLQWRKLVITGCLKKYPQIYSVIAIICIGKVAWFAVYDCGNILNVQYYIWREFLSYKINLLLTIFFGTYYCSSSRKLSILFICVINKKKYCWSDFFWEFGSGIRY